MKVRELICLGLVTMVLAAGGSVAQDPVPPAETLEGAFPAQTHYSPYAGRNFPTQVFWGDTHLHTGMSMDAGAFGARLNPDDAYRFAIGEELTSSTGLKVRLSRPLDFLVVADHSDNMGFFPRLYEGDPEMLADPTGKRWYDMVQEGGKAGVDAAVEIIIAFSRTSFHRPWHRFPVAQPIGMPGTKPSMPQRNTTTPADSPPLSATSGPPTRPATISTASWSCVTTADKAGMVEPYTTLASRWEATTRETYGIGCKATRTRPEVESWPSPTTGT